MLISSELESNGDKQDLHLAVVYHRLEDWISPQLHARKWTQRSYPGFGLLLLMMEMMMATVDMLCFALLRTQTLSYKAYPQQFHCS
jgi:hypothetical protein